MMQTGYQLGPKKRRWPKVLAGIAIIFVVLCAVAVWVLRQTYYDNLKPAGTQTQNVVITIETGTPAHDIALALKEKNLIRASWAFEWYIRSNNLRDKLQAGTYEFKQTQSVSDIVDQIVKGKVATDLFTILPGQRLDQIRAAFIKAGFTSAETDAALNPAQYVDHPALVDKPAEVNLEGYLYPDSFQKIATTRPSTIIRQSLDLMQANLTQQVRAGFVAQGLTVHQGVILASMIEQEVSKPADKPVVAQVFLKRYRIKMSLGSDPTAFYGAIIDGKEPIIGYDSPYNTRLRVGLPKGPISNVSASSLKAVAFPANTDYLFFVAGDDGVTHFSKTQAEHEALTRQYCTKLCAP